MSEEGNSLSMSEENNSLKTTQMCQICNGKQNKYCCPRCNILYCSITCYKSPNHAQCSENFYKQCVTEELSSMDSDPESKRKMLEILQRVNKIDDSPDVTNINQNIKNPDEHENLSDDEIYSDRDSDDDESIPDLALRLKDVNLDDSEAVWNLLTDDERKEFEALTKDDVTQILPIWEPWWLYRKEKKLVTPVIDEESKDESYMKLCPSIVTNIKKFSAISANKPSPCIKYNILNVLSSYIYMVRLFNGDHHESCIEAATCFILLSNNLNKDTNFDDSEIAVESVIAESLNNTAYSSHKGDNLRLDHDLKCFMIGPEESNKMFYLLCAFSDSISLLENFKKQGFLKNSIEDTTKNNFTKKFPNSDSTLSVNIQKNKVKLIIKKIEYYLSFINDHNVEIFDTWNKYF